MYKAAIFVHYYLCKACLRGKRAQTLLLRCSGSDVRRSAMPVQAEFHPSHFFVVRLTTKPAVHYQRLSPPLPHLFEHQHQLRADLHSKAAGALKLSQIKMLRKLKIIQLQNPCASFQKKICAPLPEPKYALCGAAEKFSHFALPCFYNGTEM